MATPDLTKSDIPLEIRQTLLSLLSYYARRGKTKKPRARLTLLLVSAVILLSGWCEPALSLEPHFASRFLATQIARDLFSGIIQDLNNDGFADQIYASYTDSIF